MNINRRFILTICIIVGACVSQTTPIFNTQPATSESLPLFINTLGSLDTTMTPLVTVEPGGGKTPTPTTKPDESSTQLTNTSINPTAMPPVAVEGQTSGTNGADDKFQGFQIPIKSEDEQRSPALGFLIPVTGFPPGVTTIIDMPSTFNTISPQLVIPTLDVNIPILGVEMKSGTWDVGWLWDQAGWLEGTAYPTFNGNSVLTAHVVTADGKDGPFAFLKTLTGEDYVFVLNTGFRYIYKVDSVIHVKPDDISVFAHKEDPWLTLITCDGFDEQTGEYLLRVIVRARLVEVQEIE